MKERLRKLSEVLEGKGLTSEARLLMSIDESMDKAIAPKPGPNQYSLSQASKKEYARLADISFSATNIAKLLTAHVGAVYDDPAAAKKVLQNLTAELEDLQGYVKMLDKALARDWSDVQDWETKLDADEED